MLLYTYKLGKWIRQVEISAIELMIARRNDDLFTWASVDDLTWIDGTGSNQREILEQKFEEHHRHEGLDSRNVQLIFEIIVNHIALSFRLIRIISTKENTHRQHHHTNANQYVDYRNDTMSLSHPKC